MAKETNNHIGRPVGKEIIPKEGTWQHEAYKRGQKFFEPIPSAPAAHSDEAEASAESNGSTEAALGEVTIRATTPEPGVANN